MVLDLRALSGRFAVEGPLGERRLVVQSLTLTQPSIELAASGGPSPAPTGKGSTGPLGALLSSLFKTLVIREVALDHGEIKDGLVKVDLGDKRFVMNGLNGVFGAAQPLRVSCGAELFTTDNELHVVAPAIEWEGRTPFSFDQQPNKGTLTVREARLKKDDLSVETDGIRMTLAFTRIEGRLDFDLSQWTVSGVRAEKGGAVFGPRRDINLTARGGYDWATGELRLNTWTIEMGDLLSASGSMHTRKTPQTLWSVQLDRSRVGLSPLLRSLSGGPFTLRPSEVTIEGRVRISGDLSASGTDSGLNWACDLEAASEDGVAALSRPGWSVRGKWAMRAHVTGPPSEPAITSDFKGFDLLFTQGDSSLADFSVEGSLQGKSPLFTVRGLNIHFPKQAPFPALEGLPIWPVGLQAPEAAIDLQKRTMKVNGASLTSPLFGELALSSSASEEGADVQLHGKSMPWPQWVTRPPSPLAGLEIAGSGDLGIKASLRWGDAVRLEGEIRYGQIGLQDPEAIWSGQNMALDAGFQARLDLGSTKVEGKAWVAVPQGEILADRYYFDMNHDPFKGSVAFDCDLTKKQAAARDVRIDFGSLLAVRADATLGWAGSRGKKTVHIQLNPAPAAPLYERFLKDPFKQEHPRLEEIRLKGLVSGDIRVASADGSHRILGALKWDDGELEWEKEGVQLKGVQLRLPLWREEGEPVKGPGPGDGFFTASSVTLPFVPAQPISLTLAVGPNTLFIPAPTLVEIQGGAIRVGETACEGCFQPSREIRTSLSFNPIALNPFLPEPWRHLELATAEGDLRPVELFADRVHTKGHVTLRVFGGEIIVSDIGLEGPATASPKFLCRIDLKALNLAQLTEGTEFGKIEGVMQGHIENAVFSRGQPESFDLVLETVRKPSVPQKISVEAVDNIAAIGGGGSPFVGIAGTFVSLFRELPYEKIGIRARLENDVFRINGTIKEDGKEYLVKRGGLGGVDVVNQNPDNRIGFKDMLKRLKRVTSARQGPGAGEEEGPR
jgi:hypothetical protein